MNCTLISHDSDVDKNGEPRVRLAETHEQGLDVHIKRLIHNYVIIGSAQFLGHESKKGLSR